MKNRQLDIFCIRMRGGKDKVQIKMHSINAKDVATFDFQKMKQEGVADFFVIVEPVFSYCLYSRV